MSFKKLMQALMEGNETSQDQLRQTMASFIAALKEYQVNKVRLYVYNSANYGHQATTVHLMRRFIELTEYSDEIQVTYEPDITLPKKLSLLIPGLDPRRIEEAGYTIPYLNATLTFLKVNPLEPPAEECQLGFTGGADNEGENLAQKINVEGLLRMQPYIWKKSFGSGLFFLNQVELKIGEFVDITSLNTAYNLLPYKFDIKSVQSVPSTVWDWYTTTQTFDDALKLRVNNCNALVNACTEKKIVKIWPAYGLHQFQRSGFGGAGKDTLFNIVTAGVVYQNRYDKTPVVLTLLNNDKQLDFTYLKTIKEGGFSALIDLLIEQAKVVSGVTAETEAVNKWKFAKPGKFLTQKRIDQYLEEASKSLVNAKQVFSTEQQKIEYFSKQTSELIGDLNFSQIVQFPKSLTPDDISSCIRSLVDNQIAIIQIGPQPQDIFNYLYYSAKMPCIFEGQGTSSLVISLGKPYFQMNKETNTSVNYPTVPPIDKVANELQCRLQYTSNLIRYSLDNYIDNKVINFDGRKPKTYSEALEEIVSCMNAMWTESEVFDYFSLLIRTFQKKEQYDKSFMGFCATELVGSKSFFDHANVSQELMVQAAPLTLEKIYQNLLNSWQDGSVDIIAALPGSYFSKFYTPVTGGTFVVEVSKEDITETKDDSGTITSVSMTGGSSRIFSGLFTIELNFYIEAKNIASHLTCRAVNSWNLESIPWIGFENPGFVMKVFETSFSANGGLIGNIKGTGLEVLIRYPAVNNQWVVSGSFSLPYPGIATFYQMAGGVNLVQGLPAPLNAMAGFGLSDLEFMYNTRKLSISYFSFTMKTSEPWVILTRPEFKITPSVQVAITDPASLSTRKTSYTITGQLTIGDGTVLVTATYPNFQLRTSLVSGNISLSDLVKIFKVAVDLQSEVTSFDMSMTPATGNYEISADIEASWLIPNKESPLFAINSLSFDVAGKSSTHEVTLSGRTEILPNSMAIEVTITAKYTTETFWTFYGQQTSGEVSIGALLKEYLGWNTDQKLGINGLGISIETKTSSYEFTGKTAEPWVITPLNLSISANVTLGHNTGSQSIGLPVQRRSKAEMPVLIIDKAARSLPVLLSNEDTSGSYGEVSAEIVWNNIDLLIAYNFNPTVKSFEVTWGILTGKIEEKEIDKAIHQIATLQFTQSTTLGSMIEIMVSWATGSRFSLSTPWNVLDKITLSNFELVWDFTDKTVQIKVNIGPIDMGFVTIKSIGLSYEKSGKNAVEKSVMIDLDATFIWGEKIPKWDATKPETTPAPEGSGNKYLDLRMLAMGQHITFDGFKDADTVQKAIALMADMPEPKSDEIPAVTFDADSSWLFAADFGVLRVKDTPNYTLTLQTIFNDPNLYALRIALDKDAPAAKLFQGLDFQIMYRKLTDDLGVYKSEITLPDVMRYMTVGAYSITLPVFGIEIYTNGDFKVDIGFPWNENFSRSFSIEAIVPPGIPLIGSGGIYFGKIPQVVANVPAATNGHFNPILVMGFGAQLGLGKSIQYGILKAGFSLTVFGILEGLLAKWNPYNGTSTGGGSALDIQGEYFFRIQGTFGLIGKIYGSVDFAIIKADVNITIKVFAQITFASYEPIPISVVASVEASASIKIDLGLFSIRIHFSFSVRVKETFIIGALQDPKNAPWKVEAPGVQGRLSSPLSSRLRDHALALTMTATKEVTPVWSRLLKAEKPVPLEGYLSFGLTVAGDDAFLNKGQPDKSKQEACYITSFFIKSVPPASENDHSGALKAIGKADDSSFEILAKMVTRWAIASIQSDNISPDKVDNLIVTDEDLQGLLKYLEGSKEQPVPIPAKSIESFLTDQLKLTLSMPDHAGSENAAFFPMALSVALNRPAYGDSPLLDYTFNDYNTISPDFISWLRSYFNQLAVQVQQEGDGGNSLLHALLEKETSFAEFVFTDYFLLIMRQMLQALRDGLRTFKFPINTTDVIEPGGPVIPVNTGNKIVFWVHTKGDLNGQYDLNDLFEGNADHKLTVKSILIISGMNYSVVASDSFESIAKKVQFGASFNASNLAVSNADKSDILNNGQKITYPGKDNYIIDGSMTLKAIAETKFKVSLDELLQNSNILNGENLLAPFATLKLPDFKYTVVDGDTINKLAAAHGLDNKALATKENGEVTDLFESSDDPYLNLVHLPQFNVGELIGEAQRAKALEHLSGMVSRYYLHGMRLPTEKITPLKEGMWVKKDASSGALSLPEFAGLFALTGQQFAIPELDKEPLTITVTRPESLKWLAFAGEVNSLSYTIKSSDDNYKQVQALHNYAVQNALNTELKSIGAECMVEINLSMYPLSSSIPCQTTTSIDYPNGGLVAGDTPPRLWYLPDSMRSLPLPVDATHDTFPAFSLQTHRYNEATGTSDVADVKNYGWATAVEFTIKRLSSNDGDTAYDNTYEIMGASGQAAVLLERIVQIDLDNACSLLTLGYTSNENGTDSALRIAMGADITMGLTQANLSTITRPPTIMLLETVEGEAETITLLNSPSNFVTLLWEASITRAGGFYLYYNEKNEGGLPDVIFNNKGEANVTLLVMYKNTASINPLRSYMNAALIGDSITSSTGAVVAQAVSSKESHSVAENETPDSIVKKYYSSLLSLVQNNPDIEFFENSVYTLVNATYMVTSDDTGPGGKITAIAGYFAMTEQAIKDANPRIPETTWSGGLPDNTAIRLPKVSRTAGKDPGGVTLQKIADYYGSSAAAIVGENREISGLIKTEQILTVSTGPFSLSGGNSPGVQAIGATRQGLPKMPDTTNSTYSKDYLLYLYTMLGYRVLNNQDFIGSNIGLPLGPKGKPSSGSMDKIRSVKTMSESDLMEYAKGAPYANLISDGNGSSEPVTNPYQSIGRLLQIEYSWNDIYGNRLVTQLDEGVPINGKKPQTPILTGYTDPLVGLSQWPGVSSHWTVALASDDSEFLLVTEMSFDPSPYNKPEKGDSGTWQTRAKNGLVTYERLLTQLSDPNGIALSYKTGLVSEPAVVPADQIGTLTSPDSTLLGWLFAIKNFLEKRAEGDSTYPEPAKKTISLSAISKKADLNSEQIFVLDFEFIVSRTQGIAQGDFAAMPSVRKIATQVTPITITKVDDGNQNGADSNKSGLEQFAKDIEGVLSEPDKFTLTVGTGEDRLKAEAGGSTSTVWGVRLGDNEQNAISFSINNTDSPQIFAPRPVSNKLETKHGITIKDYVSADDFDLKTNTLSGPEKILNFSDIDLDDWVRQLFNSIDNLLSPEYLSSILVIDNNPTALPAGITGFNESFNVQKKVLANVVKNLVSSVYQTQESSLIDSAREVLYQQLLEKLSSLYSIKSVVSFSAKVKSEPSASGDSPQLYGNIAFNNSNADNLTENSKVVLTSPKLELKTNEKSPLTFIVEAPALLKSGNAGIVPTLPLDIRFEGASIEHQIASIKDYKASTWLGLVRPETAGRLQVDLGKFEVPMFIRAFPATPRMDVQSGVPFKTDTSSSLQDLIAWNYSFTYSQDFHYPQDKVYAEIEYNLTPSGLQMFAATEDAFQPLAQFVTAKKRLEELLKETVPGISAKTDDQKKIKDAGKVLGAYLKMVTDVANASEEGSFFNSQILPALLGDTALKYAFHIEEREQKFKVKIDEKPVTINTWVIKIVSKNGIPPTGLLADQRPIINIAGKFSRNEVQDNDPVVGTNWSMGIYAYWYSLDGVPLTGDKAQVIEERHMVMPGMNILERQDAKSTIFLKRNEELVAGHPSAEDFIYKTPKVSFTNPLFPTIDQSRPFNIATLEIATLENECQPKSLPDILSIFFTKLFTMSVGETQTIQITCQYAYTLAENIEPINLPVLMLPPISINPKTDFNLPKNGCPDIEQGSDHTPFVCQLSNSILNWFSQNKPENKGGKFIFDLTVMSELTQHSMPLIRLREVYFDIKDVSSF